MLINEVLRECRLTRKAVEYYEAQGLIAPKVGENGYRNYSPDDIAVLKEIRVLRKLGLSISEIKEILASPHKPSTLAKCKYRMELEVEKAEARKRCLEHLAKDYDVDEASRFIDEEMEQQFTIKEKLLQAFPGGYGLYLCMHFGPFLHGSIDTPEKERAYNQIIEYLDSVQQMEFPRELEEFLEQGLGHMEEEQIQSLNGAVMDAVDNPERYLEEHRETIQKYLEYVDSEAYKNSPACQMKQMFVKFQKESGYYDVFIENLKILSESYREYDQKLRAANKILLEKFPCADNPVNIK